MSTHYPNAPITEAIIDLRVMPAEGADHALLKLSEDRFLIDYPQQDEIFEAVGQMAVGPRGGSASVQQSPIGWKFTSGDQKRIVQSRVNGSLHVEKNAIFEACITDTARRLFSSCPF